MSRYEYKVVPFMGQVQAKESSSVVSQQLESILNQHAADGWELHSLGSVDIEVQPGCLSTFLGQKTSYVRHDQVILRRSVA